MWNLLSWMEEGVFWKKKNYEIANRIENFIEAKIKIDIYYRGKKHR